MKKTNKRLKLPKFDYAISPQQPFIRDNLKSNKKVKSLSSPMTLNLGLLHELDLFRVFDMMHSNVKSQFTIDSCDLTLRTQQKELKVDQENIDAQCTMSWLSIKVADK